MERRETKKNFWSIPGDAMRLIISRLEILYSQKEHFGFVPTEDRCNILRGLADEETGVVIISRERDKTQRQETLDWLEMNDIPCDRLLTKEDDFRTDSEIWFTMESDEENVKFWREEGHTCLQVDNGI